MRHSFFFAITVKIANRLKPLLIRLLPITFLRKAKKAITAHAMNHLSETAFLPFDRNAYPDGINLIGDIRGEIGLGQSCRLVADALQASGLDFGIHHFDQLSAVRHGDVSWDWKITGTTPYNINLFHINPYDLPAAFLRLKQNIWDRRYNIGFWLWELEDFPHEWLNGLKLVNEVWTPSEHTGSSIRQVTDKPVYTVPYAVSAPVSGQFDRAYFHLPDDRFLFLCMYDCNSCIERKNPLGAITAFRQAFPDASSHSGLVVKVNNPREKDLRLLQKALGNHPHVYVLSDVLDKTQVNALIACADVYVSLHRAEGFGLVPAEAMLLGTPVIATNWSANTEFMNHEVACMVDFNFAVISEDTGPYKKGGRWADPDVRQAAGFMRRLYEDTVFYREKREKAKAFIAEKLSAERAAALIRRRIHEIYGSYSPKAGFRQ